MLKIDPRGGSNRYNCNYDFFKKWSNEMAYVLGFLYADGDIVDAKSSRTQYIKFTSTDKEQVVSIKRLLKSKHNISERPPRIGVFRNGSYLCKRSYSLRIGNRVMYDDLKRLGLSPNKSKTVKFPTTIPNKYLNQFIRGYFDGDGCVYLQITRNKNQEDIPRRLRVIFTSGSKVFLYILRLKIKRFVGLKQNKIYYSQGAYQIQYSTLDSVRLFKFLYKNSPENVYLKRKFDIFSRYFQMRPERIDKGIKKLLDMAWCPSS